MNNTLELAEIDFNQLIKEVKESNNLNYIYNWYARKVDIKVGSLYNHFKRMDEIIRIVSDLEPGITLFRRSVNPIVEFPDLFKSVKYGNKTKN